jgi:hypothetical protein
MYVDSDRQVTLKTIHVLSLHLCTVIISLISTHQVFSDHQRASVSSSRFRNEVFGRCGWYLLGDLDDPRMKKQAAV